MDANKLIAEADKATDKYMDMSDMAGKLAFKVGYLQSTIRTLCKSIEKLEEKDSEFEKLKEEWWQQQNDDEQFQADHDPLNDAQPPF